MINFFRNIFGTSLKSKVMKVIEKKINEAEKALSTELKQLKDLRYNQIERAGKVYLQEVSSARHTHNQGKIEATEKHVNNLLSKIL